LRNQRAQAFKRYSDIDVFIFDKSSSFYLINMPKKKGRGRPRKHRDALHKYWREHQQEYYYRNREAVLLGMKLKISVKEARERLKELKRGKSNEQEKR